MGTTPATMAEVIREGQSVRVILVDGDTEASAPVIEKVTIRP